MSDPAAWVGRREVASFPLDPWPAQALAAALDRPDRPRAGDELPPFWHHLYGHDATAASATGPDGHAARGGFLPPVELPRRMWAGGRLRFERPLVLGQTALRVSEIKSVTAKQGRTGSLVFVLVEHTLSSPDGPAVIEEHDVVYREAPRQSEGADVPAASAAPEPGPWQRHWRPDEVLLFRYSALTYNGHRIHYDDRYATGVEGYAGLIVHGPLLATLLLELVREWAPARRLARFEFKAHAPLTVGEDLTVHGRPEGATVGLWVTGPRGVAMRGAAVLD